ncbi:MAG: class I SAM-dependent methyltransferase [Chloroflexi bacterium]|nr:class I SAM-dependent methyltransferase [Chloroflexota bacterium]
MDDLASFNQSKWDELARRGVLYARPLLDLTPETARQWLDPYGYLGDVRDQEVLCLASGGGKQSAAFSVMGAHVTVLDLSPAMLERDRQAADHYGYSIELHQGDMRDLSRYPDAHFDLVWQPYSINFIPDPQPVFRQVARLLKPGGHYHLQIHNPFVQGLDETSWTGSGYLLCQPYTNGAEVDEAPWEFEDEQGSLVKVPGPRAFRHTLSAVINGLAALGFNLRGLWEEIGQDPEAAPGLWDHFIRIAPPWLTLWFSF